MLAAQVNVRPGQFAIADRIGWLALFEQELSFLTITYRPHWQPDGPIFDIAACEIQVAGRTNDAAGDGTTTAAVLARELIYHGLQVSLPE